MEGETRERECVCVWTGAFQPTLTLTNSVLLQPVLRSQDDDPSFEKKKSFVMNRCLGLLNFKK